MSNEAPERVEDEMFRLFEHLREKRLRHAAVGFVMDLLHHVIMLEESQSGGVVPKDMDSIERSVAVRKRDSSLDRQFPLDASRREAGNRYGRDRPNPDRSPTNRG